MSQWKYLPMNSQRGIAPIILLIAIAAALSIITLSQRLKGEVTTQTETAQVTPAPTIEPTPTPYPTPTPSPTLAPTKAPAPATPKPSVVPPPPPAPVNNTPPSAGYSKQSINVGGLGVYIVDIVAADLNSTRVIVDTASDGTCTNNCPVLPLATYVSRSGAYAGVNGSYFCPEAYPQCAGKTNSFDTLLMNKNKVYFNSDNNVYSNVPAVIFNGTSVRYVGASSEWGRDTGVDAVIANHPLLLTGKEVRFGGNDDPKQGSKGNRSFVGNTGTTVYIGVVRNVTVAEAARVLQAMGMENALNLDNGGSTALYIGGYKLGPGRNIPNALLFVQK